MRSKTVALKRALDELQKAREWASEHYLPGMDDLRLAIDQANNLLLSVLPLENKKGAERQGLSKRYIKGRVGFMRGTGWPVVILERARSEEPMTPVLCEVWGDEHESGSVYLKDIHIEGEYTADEWKAELVAMGHTSMYFKGRLTTEDIP